MTVNDIILKIRAEKDSAQISEAQLLKYLSRIEKTVYTEIVSVRQGREDIKSAPIYDSETDFETELLADDEYAELYFFYLCSKIDLNNCDIDLYNNDMIMFNTIFQEYKNSYFAEHRQKAQYELKV